MLEILFAGCLGLFPAILLQLTHKLCAAAKNCQKNSLKPPFLGFKVIEIDECKRPVASAHYDMQLVCTYLQPFSHYTSQQRQNDVFLLGVPLFDFLVRGEPPHPGHKICHDKLESLWQPTVKIS